MTLKLSQKPVGHVGGSHLTIRIFGSLSIASLSCDQTLRYWCSRGTLVVPTAGSVNLVGKSSAGLVSLDGRLPDGRSKSSLLMTANQRDLRQV